MGLKISINKKILFNGKEYGSADEIPPKEREIYEKAMAALKGGSKDVVIKGGNKILFNGKEYSNIDEMPPKARAIYLKAVSKMSENGELTDAGAGPNPGSKLSLNLSVATPSGNQIKVPLLTLAVVGIFVLAVIVAGRSGDFSSLIRFSKLLWLGVIPLGFIIYLMFRRTTYRTCRYCGAKFEVKRGRIPSRVCPRCGR